jgi:putative glycerol-1-phosphate prenyltransferase
LAKVHALAANFLGMKLVYLEAGSGGVLPVPVEMISAVADYGGLPVIVGGGIRQPHDAAERVQAGASFVVLGTCLEKNHDPGYMAEMAAAIHTSARVTI